MLTAGRYRDKIIGLQRQKDFREAFEAVKNALALYPTNTFFLSDEIYLLYKLNKVKEARQRAEERIDFLKNDPFFLKIYLTILEKLGARADFEDFIERHIFARRSGNEDLYVFVSQIVERVLGRDRALDTVSRSLAFFPDSEKLRALPGSLKKTGGTGSGYKYYREQFKDKKPEEAIREIEEIRILPDYADDFKLLSYLAELYKKQGDYEKAIGIYKRLLTLKDNEFTRKMLGYAYYKQDDYQSALVYLRDIFLKDPDDHFMYSAVYRIFKENRDSEGLDRLINEALGLHPSSRHLYGLLARAKKWRKD